MIRTLWTSEQVSQRDRLGLFAKFNPPVVANGKVFVATYGDTEPLQIYAENSRPTQFPKNYYVAVYSERLGAPPPQRVVDQDRNDVTLVRAATTPLTFDASRCTPIDAASIDCTDALSQASGLKLSSGRVCHEPQYSQLLLAARNHRRSKFRIAERRGDRFWSSQALAGNQTAGDSGRLIPKAQLKPVGNATLKNGAAATLHEFVGVTNCSTGGSQEVDRLFKPYMQFDDTRHTIYRIWDLASNYLINRAAPQFDRSADVLQ